MDRTSGEFRDPHHSPDFIQGQANGVGHALKFFHYVWFDVIL
jgi:hypothetical protein